MYDCRCENKAASWQCDFNPFAFGNKRATSDRTNSLSFVPWKTAMIFNSPFEYDVIETFIWAHEELVYSICSHEQDRLNFGMLTVETAVFDCICWFSSSRDRKGQSYPVEYYLELVKEYSKGKIHKSESEPGSGYVNTVYFVHQARGNTRVCLRWTSTGLQMFTYIWASCLE